MGTLTRDIAGNLSGTTVLSIRHCRSGGGCGTVFKLTPKGKFTVLHRFTWAKKREGAWPMGGVVRDANGNLFGTTFYGGGTEKICVTNAGPGGCGTVFELDKSGKLTVLHRFAVTSLADGNTPIAGLLLDDSGNC